MTLDNGSGKVLRLFVASPGDVADERDAVEQVAGRVSKQLERAAIEVYRREEGLPALGDRARGAPEASVDVFVLILWQRYGTIRPDGLSGTEAEFRQAWRAWQETGRPKILAYLCTVGSPVLSVDLDQAKRLQGFVADLKEKGILLSYADHAEFHRIFGDHLHRVLRELDEPVRPAAGPRASRRPSREASSLLAQIRAARERISEHIVRTPLVRAKQLEQDLHCKKILLKLECLQVTGSFKVRGAMNAVLRRDDSPSAPPFATASAGNHGLGLAYSANRFRRESVVYMPERTPLTKRKAIERFTRNVNLTGRTFEETKEYAVVESQANGYTFIHPFDDPDVIAGQGTLGLEIIRDVEEQCHGEPPDLIVFPVGGGGLIAGAGTAIRERWPNTRIVGAEARNVPSLGAALRAGRPRTVINAGTFADGIAVSEVGERSFAIAREVVDEVWEVAEESMAKAVIRLIEDVRVLAEGAGACGLGGLFDKQASDAGAISNQSVLVIVSGGNLDTIALSKLLQRGLVLSRRLAHLRFIVEDIPGSLGRLTSDLAELQVNILDLWHSRLNAYLSVGKTQVDTIVETRDADHANSVREALAARGHDVQLVTE
ncbi:MAG TPA: pyridoxal-phosphate dependent enzyme [Thermoanaerobaculia bacterium]